MPTRQKPCHSACLALLASCATPLEKAAFITVAGQPANVGDAKIAALAYHDSGEYARDLTLLAARLFMVPNGAHFASAADFKAPIRAEIERLGYTIIATRERLPTSRLSPLAPLPHLAHYLLQTLGSLGQQGRSTNRAAPGPQNWLSNWTKTD
jgi:hypothetical protein